jgi:YggT family protein
VLPLRRVIAGVRGIDWASVVAALLTALVYVVLMVVMAGFDPASVIATLVVVALLTVVKWALNLVIWMTILMALLSWLNPRSPAMPILYQLTAPFLNPLRRVPEPRRHRPVADPAVRDRAGAADDRHAQPCR